MTGEPPKSRCDYCQAYVYGIDYDGVEIALANHHAAHDAARAEMHTILYHIQDTLPWFMRTLPGRIHAWRKNLIEKRIGRR